MNLYSQKNNQEFASTEGQPSVVSKHSKKPSYLGYVDATGDFDNKQLQRSLWYVKHKLLLYRLFVGILIFSSIFFWIFSLWQWIDYVVFGIRAEQTLFVNLTSFPNYTVIHAHYSPQPLTILQTHAFQSGVDKYDAVAEVVNTNDRFIVEFDYVMVVDGTPLVRHHALLLPGEVRPLVEFGLERNNAPGSVGVNIENIAWHRVPSKEVPDTKSWQAERLNFVADKFELTPPDTIRGANAFGIHFNLINNSPYGYSEPEFIIGLVSGGELVGVLPLHLLSLASQEVRPIDVRSFSPNLTATDIKIFPLINVYDKGVYGEPPK